MPSPMHQTTDLRQPLLADNNGHSDATPHVIVSRSNNTPPNTPNVSNAFSYQPISQEPATESAENINHVVNISEPSANEEKPAVEQPIKLATGTENVASLTQPISTVTAADVIKADERGQIIVQGEEDPLFLQFCIAVGLPAINELLWLGMKRIAEDYNGPLENTSAGEYGNSQLDSTVPQVLTLLELGVYSWFKKNPKYVIEQTMVGIGSSISGSVIMQTLGINSLMEQKEIHKTGREMFRAFSGGVTGYLTKKIGLFSHKVACSKKTEVILPETKLAENVAPAQTEVLSVRKRK